MKEEELIRLIEKYYNCESTEAEESALRDHFNGNMTFKGYEAEKGIFVYYKSANKEPEPSVGFEDRIMAAVDSYDQKEESNKIRKFVFPYIGVAAGLLILVGSYFFFTQRNNAEDTFTDPEIAYAETCKILRDISSQLNQGTHNLEPVSKMNAIMTKSFDAINRSSVLIEKNLTNINYLQGVIEKIQDSVKIEVYK
jgi:hypothetical protein